MTYTAFTYGDPTTPTGAVIAFTSGLKCPFNAGSGGNNVPVPVGGILETATLGAAYSLALSVSGGLAPYTFHSPSGSLPTGLSLSTAGVISGTPTATGTFTFTVSVTDSAGEAGSAIFEIIVVSAAENYGFVG